MLFCKTYLSFAKNRRLRRSSFLKRELLKDKLKKLNETIVKLLFSFRYNLEWLQLRYPSEELETLGAEILIERLSKFYKELKQDEGKDYSRSAYEAMRTGINRYLTSETVGKTFSIITDPIFKTANKSLNAKLRKKIKESGK